MAGDRGGPASIRPPQRLQDRRGWMGQGSRYPLESPEAVTTMLKCNCRPCSHVVDAEQHAVGSRRVRRRAISNPTASPAKGKEGSGTILRRGAAIWVFPQRSAAHTHTEVSQPSEL